MGWKYSFDFYNTPIINCRIYNSSINYFSDKF